MVYCKEPNTNVPVKPGQKAIRNEQMNPTPYLSLNSPQCIRNASANSSSNALMSP